MKEITLRVSDDVALMVEQWALLIPEMEIVAKEQPVEYWLGDMDMKMTLALKELEKNDVIQHLYDYTWIMVAINDGAIKGIGSFRSPQSFIDYLKGLGIEKVPSRSLISSFLDKVLGTYPDWVFVDTEDPREKLRRKNVVRQLISALNMASKQSTEQKAGQSE